MTQRVSAKSCPICGRPAVPACSPFCSGRCADVDLNRWLSEVYRVPAAEPDDAEQVERQAVDPIDRRGS